MAHFPALAIGKSAPSPISSEEKSDEISDTDTDTETKLADRSPVVRFSSTKDKDSARSSSSGSSHQQANGLPFFGEQKVPLSKRGRLQAAHLYSVAPPPQVSDSWTLCRCLARTNQGVHGFRGLKFWVQEIPIFIGGVAFNPVFIIWTVLLVYLLFDLRIEFEGASRRTEPSRAYSTWWGGRYGRAIAQAFWDQDAGHEHTEPRASNFTSINSQAYSLRPLLRGLDVLQGRFYRWYTLTALMTLPVTEILKFCFRSPRPDYNFYATQCLLPAPRQPLKRRQYWGRHFKFPNLYHTRYAFPSGDTAQAANFGLFMFVFGGYVSGICVLLPLVAFARVFYVCHWIEDTIGGCLVGTVTQSFMYLYLVKSSAGVGAGSG